MCMCRHEFKVTSPVLIIVPSAVIDFWRGEWEFWSGAANALEDSSTLPAAASVSAGPSTAECSSSSTLRHGNLVCYSGVSAARNIIHDHELWLQPGSLDGKATGRGRPFARVSR